MTAQLTESTKQSKKIDEKNEPSPNRITCGIIMPIATMSPDYTSEHWEDVRAIIDTAIERAGFEPRIVSDAEDSTIIHKSIINNIYQDEIIVCDVSNKNANVMFELGMRLAFNKPVVIIKDDKTGYSFDTSNIEHIGYRKDLRHNTVEKFINDLARKIKATYEAPQKDGYQPFLSHFGKFEVAKIENKPIEGSEALEKLLNKMSALENKLSTSYLSDSKVSNLSGFSSSVYIHSDVISPENIDFIIKDLFKNIPNISTVNYNLNNKEIEISYKNKLGLADRVRIENTARAIINNHDDDLPF